MHPEPLVAAFGKIEWAVTQIEQLNADVNAFFAENTYEIIPNIEPNGASLQPIEVWRFSLKREIPARIYAQVSAILGSIREPLDQMVSAVCCHRNKSEVGIGFVFAETREKLNDALLKSQKIPKDVREMIEESEPFFDGKGHLLAVLHYLKNPDKHRSGLVPITQSTAFHIESLVVREGMVLSVGPRKGFHLKRDAANNLGQEDHAKQPPICMSEGGARIILSAFAGASAKESLELATSVLGTKFEADFKPTFEIAFGGNSRVDREPVVAVLHKARDLVEGLLLAFERRFFS